MSAKWRRNKRRLKWFDIIKASKASEKKDYLKIFKMKSMEKTYSRPYISFVPTIYKKKKTCKEPEPEPLVDIFEEGDEIVIFAALTGFKEENLKVNAKSQSVTLSARNHERKYRKSLNLPVEVIPSKIRTSYKNGVLEIRLRKAIREKAIDKMAGLESAS